MRKARSSRVLMGLSGLAVAIVIVSGGAVAATADQLVVDGIAPLDQTGQDASVTMCVGESGQVPILIAARRNGGDTKNVFNDGATVTVSLKSASTGLTVALSGPTIPIPDGWQAAKTNTLTDDTITATVTVAPTQTIGTTNGTLVFSYSGSQVGGGTVTGQASITVTSTVKTCDKTAPTLTLPSPVTAEATSSSGATVTYTATATDANPASPAVTCSPASGSTFTIGATDVQCSATDAVGNTATGQFSVTVRDTTPPVVGQPKDIGTEATGSTTTVTWTAPTAHDAVDGDLATTCAPASGTGFHVGSTQVTCSVTDAHGNTGSAGFLVIVSDTSAPTLTIPSSLVAEATGPTGAAVAFTASASDAVDGAVAVTCVPSSGSHFALATTTVNCSATDAANNTASGSFPVTVKDTKAPVVTVPADQVIEATGPGGAATTFSATASDVVSGTVSAACSAASGSTFPLGPTKVTCSATDAAGNTGSASFTVTVVDTTPPTITVPTATVRIEATGPDGAALAHYDVSAIDLVDGAVDVSCNPGEGATFAIDTPTQVTCEAVDSAGNKATKAFAVSVHDTTAPVVTVPADRTAEATGPDGATVSFTASALDIVDGSITPTCSPASGTTFALGTTEVTCSAADAHQNTGSNTFSVIVQDTTAPAVTVPHDVTEEATGPSGAVVDFDAASALDIVDGALPASCEPVSGSTFALGDHTVTCSATDAHHNTGANSFHVIVQDTTAPALTVPSKVTAEATGPSGAAVTFTSSATDIVDGAVASTCAPASGETFAIGDTSVTCSSTDAHGNKASKQFVVTVQDTTAPDVSVPSDITKEATGSGGAAASFTASALDIVDGGLPTICFPLSGATFPVGQTTVTCSATDAHDNTGSNTFTVTVQDTRAPDVTVPDDIVKEATGPIGAAVTFTSSALDIVDGVLPTTCDPDSGSTFGLGNTTVTCTATDKHDNTGSGSFHVKVQDTIAPKVTVATVQPVEATGPSGAAVTFTASATDIVDGAVTATCSPASGTTFALGDTTVTCTATDAHENTGSASIDVKVQDTTAPIVSVPGSMVVEATGPSGAAVTFTSSATDIVDGAVASTCAPASGSTFALGTTTVTCDATDAHLNHGSKSFPVTVKDSTPPTITWVGGPADAGSYVFGSVPAAPTCIATDVVDITATCTVAGYMVGTGLHSLTASASDAAGNTASDTRSYTVKSWTIAGFYQPVDMGNIWNTVKGGSTVPLKFEVFAGSTELTSTSVVSSFTSGVVPCGTLADPTADIELTSTGGTSLRYDTTAGQFIQNWQTPKSPGLCYKVTMKTQDGSSISALFKLK